ncbi:MAG: hypothetical protein MUO50_17385, partial [Longimicrobiales bacterium]|nr:hypothetical protein [Longimicrobiales bacterium]
MSRFWFSFPTTGAPLLASLLLIASPGLLWGQAQRTFTVDDALRVRAASIADVTEDARWIAVTAATSRDRMGTDHFRYGDPTYIGPSLAEVLVLDAETGQSQSVSDGQVQVQNLSWSPDGSRLAFRRLVDGTVRLEVWDRGSGRVRTIRLRPERELAWGGPLEWLPNGSGVLVGLRTPTWAAGARAAFEALNSGPIVVQDSSEPFLSWEAVTNRGSLMELAQVDLESGVVTVLGPEASYQDIRVAEDGSHITYTTSTPLKTSYGRDGGTEYAYFKLALAEGAEAVEVMEKGERRIRPSWSPNGSVFVFAEKGDIFSKVPEADSALNLTTDYRVPLSESDSTKRSFSLERWHPDGGSLLLRAQDGYYLMAEGEEPELVWAFPGDTREEWGDAPSLSILQWTEDGRYLYASRSAKDIWDRALVRYDLQNRRDELLVSGTDLLRSFSVAEDGSRLVFRRSDGDRPDEIWTADGDFGNARALTDMNPWLSEVALSRSQLIKYYDVDG